jgi:hypothetical protein
LRWEDRVLFLQAFWWLTVADLQLRLGATRKDLVSTNEPTCSVRRQAADIVRGRRYARWLESAARYHVIRARCLHQSLALHRWLRWEGEPTQVRIGVRITDGILQAHAWVLLGEEVINDSAAAVAEFRQLSTSHAGRKAGTAASVIAAR